MARRAYDPAELSATDPALDEDAAPLSSPAYASPLLPAERDILDRIARGEQLPDGVSAKDVLTALNLKMQFSIPKPKNEVINDTGLTIIVKSYADEPDDDETVAVPEPRTGRPPKNSIRMRRN